MSAPVGAARAAEMSEPVYSGRGVIRPVEPCFGVRGPTFGLTDPTLQMVDAGLEPLERVIEVVEAALQPAQTAVHTIQSGTEAVERPARPAVQAERKHSGHHAREPDTGHHDKLHGRQRSALGRSPSGTAVGLGDTTACRSSGSPVRTGSRGQMSKAGIRSWHVEVP